MRFLLSALEIIYVCFVRKSWSFKKTSVVY